jgi:hypothetical protein
MILKKELSAIGIALYCSIFGINNYEQCDGTKYVYECFKRCRKYERLTGSEMVQNMSSAMGNATQSANQTRGNWVRMRAILADKY